MGGNVVVAIVVGVDVVWEILDANDDSLIKKNG